MSQTPEAQAFLARVAQLPPGPGAADLLTQVLQPSLDDEAELRKLWATDKSNPRLRDLHVGLVDVFNAPDSIRTTRARVVNDETDLSARYVLPLDEKRRRKEGEPSMVSDLDTFKKTWALFTEGALSQLTDWSNVIAAGGSVQACLAPVPESAMASKRAMRKYFHHKAFPTSDVDLFLYGLTPEQAEAKMQTIYEAVRDSVPWDVTCVRTKHTVSIHSQFPYRSIQIVLRLYSSPAEILAGFDVDAPCCAYDGERVWANPRAVVAMMRQCNTVDMTRRSPSYEVRLTKYSMRDFEVYLPSLHRDDIDPTIFERSIQRVQGLARLLVLERFVDADSRQRYLVDRRKLRARPDSTFDSYSRRKKKYKGDLKANIDIGGLEMNDYDVVSLHIPYGPGWDARRIDKLVYQTDLGMNSPYNPKNKDRRLHRHPAFFGTLSECLEDCCEFCPEPKDNDEKKLQEEEDESYVRGRIQFIEEDPGRQSISGSFNPIDEGEWAEQAYMGPTEKLFSAIVLGDRAEVKKIVSADGFDIDRRDHVGRTPLQIAILSKEIDIACDLIDAGARMTSRLVDGRTALHLAAQLDLPTLIRKLLERSAINAEKAAEEEAAAGEAKDDADEQMDVDDEDGVADEDGGEEGGKDGEGEEDDEEGDNSQDDWSSDDEDGKTKEQDKKEDVGQIPEDDEDEPDVFNVDLPDWDYALTPLQYAVIFGSLGAVDELIAGGADATLVTTKGEGWYKRAFHPLTLTALTEDVGVATEMVKKLVAAGATSSQADEDLFTIFHKIVCVRKPGLVEAFLSHDANAKAVLDSPLVTANVQVTFPVVSAIGSNQLATLAILLAYGAKLTFTEEDHSRAKELSGQINEWMLSYSGWQNLIFWPVETAISQFSDAIDLLVKVGADFNIGIQNAYTQNTKAPGRKTIIDAVRGMLAVAKKDVENTPKEWDEQSRKSTYQDLAKLDGWKGAFGKLLLKIVEEAEADVSLDASNMSRRKALGAPTTAQRSTAFANLQHSVEYLTKVEALLTAQGAKSWKELHPDEVTAENHADYFRSVHLRSLSRQNKPGFERLTATWRFDAVASHLEAAYEELFQACCDGDNAKIEQLCLPPKDGKADQQLIHITVRFGDGGASITPLSLALEHRHWPTARLVLAIAVAQYKPTDKTTKYKIPKVTLDADDSGSDSDEDSDMEDGDGPEEINFIDIAKRRSTVETDAHPEKLLNIGLRLFDPKAREQVNGPVLFRAVLDDDFEAFVQIADLYKSLPKPLDLPDMVLEWLIRYDRSTMLDELIRRTGAGIHLPEEEHDDEDQTDEQQKPKKVPLKTYLGLNVHGKKRKDLAQKSDPNAPIAQKKHETPLLWRAAREGALECLRYLSSERAVGAYQYYASTHSDEHAQYLKRITAQIPQRIGWSIDELNESVITAAVIGDRMEILKTVIDLQPAALQSALIARINYVGFNHILVAANWGCSPEMFDYLLSKGVSPSDTDVRGWNILHILCVHNDKKHLELLKHVLHKLPQELIECMLLQQSKKALNTPLHIAVKKAALNTVRVLLQANAPAFLIRDNGGSSPLHCAVSQSRAEITRLLGDAGPDEAFALEDGVGNTPVEIAVSKWLQGATGQEWPGAVPRLSSISDNLRFLQSDHHHTSMEEVQTFKETLGRLSSLGRLRNGTKLATELAAFADRLEVTVQERADASTSDDKTDNDESATDCAYAKKTLDYVIGALASKPGLCRQLVHLIDVHRSVKGSLDRSQRIMDDSNNNYNTSRSRDDEGGLDPEEVEDKEQKVKTHSAVAQWHVGGFDVFGDDPL
ncbi:ankyrin [Daedaleopsis nitida]|nr:ankyrin [Daedaleopsis nitida]